MIQLTKTSNETFYINHLQIQCIELIPETKIVMMNHDYYLVHESMDQILTKIADYNARVLGGTLPAAASALMR